MPAVICTTDESTLVLDAITNAQRVAGASPDDQRRELAAAAQAFSRERDTGSRLRYGVLLAMPVLAGTDPQRAATTLEPLSMAGNNGPVRQFATLMLGQINERQKEQRRALQLKEQLDEQSTERQKEQRRGQQLKEQLDELRAVERTLIERGQPRK